MELCLVTEPPLSGDISATYAAAGLLAYDEVLLNWMDQHQPDFGLMRLWEASSTFVVMGYGKQVSADIHLAACESDGVPVLRRCTGGGTVLQTIGCLSYSFVLPIGIHDSLNSIQSTTSWLMTQQAACLTEFLGMQVSVQGTSDLTVDTLKISGNAQRRGRRSVLFHGTFLCQVDIAAIGTYLQIPNYQPEYRQNRSHWDFLRSMDVAPKLLSQHVSQFWNAKKHESLPYTDFSTACMVLTEKYLNPEFIYQR